MTPLLVFGISEIRASWPSTIIDQITGFTGPGGAVVLSIAFLAFLVAYLAVHEYDRGSRAAVISFNRAPFDMRLSDSAIWIGLGLLIVVLLILGTFLYRGVPPVVGTIQAVLSQTSSSDAFISLSNTREEITKGHVFGGADRGAGFVRTILQVGWTYVCAAAVVLHVRTPSRRSLIRAGLVIVTALIYVGGAGVRSQMVLIVVAVIISVTLVRRVRSRQILVCTMALFAFIFMIAPLSGKYTTVSSASAYIGRTVERVFVGNGVNNSRIINFLDQGALEYGRGTLHFEQIAAAVPGVAVTTPFANRVQLLRADATSTTGYATPTYFGTIYADFGPWAVPIFYAALGGLTAMMQTRLFRRTKDPLRVAFMASFLAFYSQLPVSSPVRVSVLVAMLAFVHATSLLSIRLLQGRQGLAVTLPRPSAVIRPGVAPTAMTRR